VPSPTPLAPSRREGIPSSGKKGEPEIGLLACEGGSYYSLEKTSKKRTGGGVGKRERLSSARMEARPSSFHAGGRVAAKKKNTRKKSKGKKKQPKSNVSLAFLHGKQATLHLYREYREKVNWIKRGGSGKRKIADRSPLRKKEARQPLYTKKEK